ncbi:ATP-grasp domain-containing protein [Streptomyces montanisoli]|uniref:ATP-grasp domain-containing protein n=1 Tax=Streptomyces montanisoli TaxID=2798581 RepID=A0A940MJH1_9ACTN|nr:ATP-grasp domain-containing protein [Streptomyces montanisoli]MBP0460441.1 ATP-grasp domain-containing protein [Streptomyces montanisoli]
MSTDSPEPGTSLRDTPLQPVLLVMRNTFGWNAEHIEAMQRLGLEIHLVTQVKASLDDPRFASVVLLEPGLDMDTTEKIVLDAARERDITHVFTFYESDITLVSRVNTVLGHAWANHEADVIARDKRLQREFLTEHGIPSAKYAAVEGVASGIEAAADFAYPVIVKPSNLSASIGVSLAGNEDQLTAALAEIESLSGHWDDYFLSGRPAEIALLEEFLPGREVTLDGVVLHGEFHLSGVTDKMQMPGPYFEEDYYTLPFRTPQEEPELVALTERIVRGLGVRHCLFNAEFRKHADGTYRVVEFSNRLSGGQNYRNLREVYGLDPVRLWLKALLQDEDLDPVTAKAQLWHGEVRRTAPQAATCIKFAYREGRLLRNNPGDTYHSPYFRSYLPGSKVGSLLRRAPEGWYEIAGSLAVSCPYHGPEDIDRIERLATELDEQLDIIVTPR